MQRKSTNALLGAGSFIGLVGTAAIWILDTVGRIQTAQSLFTAFTVAGVTINWGAIYFYLFVICTAFLVAVNWDLFIQWRRREERYRNRAWDMPAFEAINHIAAGSMLGRTFNRNNKIQQAADALIQAAKSGRVLLAGRADNGQTGAISKRILKREELRFTSVRDMNNRDAFRATETRIVSRKHPDRTLFENLMMDRTQILLAFP